MEPMKTFKYRPGPDRFVDEDWIYRHSEWMERWKKYQQEKDLHTEDYLW